MCTVSVYFLNFWSFDKTNRFHVAVGLFSNRSQKMSKCGRNICSDTLACGSCTTSLFSAHFDVICDLLLNRRTVTRNLFVNSTNLGLELRTLWSAPMYWELWLGPVLRAYKQRCSQNPRSHFNCNFQWPLNFLKNIFYLNGRNYRMPAIKLTVMLSHLLCCWNFLTERMQNLECVFEVNQTTHSVENYLSGRGLAFCTQSMCILRKLNRFEQDD